jgi:hypothetical protein
MNDKFDEKEEQRNEGLSTAALAGAGERSSTAGATAASVAATPAEEEESVQLISADEAGTLRRRWDEVQAAFVDEPRKAVEQADYLVATAMKRLAEMFAEERANLEGQWDRGDDVSTEDLRIALRRYRSFFNRLLKI